MKRPGSLIVILLMLLGLLGCSRDEGPAPVVAPEPQPVKVLLTEAIDLQRVELSGATLPAWRSARGNRPALLLLAADPMLRPAPAGLQSRIARLLAEGDAAELTRQADPLRNPDPLLLPGMTVDAALRSGWFGELVWVVPHSDNQEEISGTLLRDQLLTASLINAEEADAMQTGDDILLSGRLRGVAFRAVTLDTLPKLAGPVVLHLDQDWFRESYRTEISTPMLGLLVETFVRLRSLQLQAVAVTFCYGNLDRRIALDVRFAADMIGEMLARPAILDEPPPENWRRIKDILYLQNFMKKEMVGELTEQMVQDDPDAAWVHFAAYRAAADMRDSEAALMQLAEAVQRDPVYALEYRDLMERAYGFGDLRGAMRMLERAREGLPDNLEIKLEMARLANDMSDYDRARRLVGELLKLNWSSTYFAGTPDYLHGFLEHLEMPVVESSAPAAGAKPSADEPLLDDTATRTERQRILHPSQSR